MNGTPIPATPEWSDFDLEQFLLAAGVCLSIDYELPVLGPSGTSVR